MTTAVEKITAVVFNRGIPTQIEVDKLFAALDVPEITSVIEYNQISEIIGVKKETYRWKSVVVAWRGKLERDHNIILRAIPTVGFEVCDNSARVDVASRKYKGGLRKIAKASQIAIKTGSKGLSDNEIRTRDFYAKTGGLLATTSATEARRLQVSWDNGNGGSGEKK